MLGGSSLREGLFADKAPARAWADDNEHLADLVGASGASGYIVFVVGSHVPLAPSLRQSAADFPDEVLEKLELLDRKFFSYPHNLRICFVPVFPSIRTNLVLCRSRTTFTFQ